LNIILIYSTQNSFISISCWSLSSPWSSWCSIFSYSVRRVLLGYSILKW
jgi:hypothetical protein